MTAVQHGTRCKCGWCHGLRCQALLQPGAFGRKEGICTDCDGAADAPWRASYYPLCEKCAFARYAALDYGLTGMIQVIEPVVRSVLEDFHLVRRGECSQCGLGNVLCAGTDSEWGEEYSGLCITCVARKALDTVLP